MPDISTSQSLNRPAEVAPLGRRVASGFAWGLAGTIACRMLMMVSQLVLAWILRPEDFGLIGLAYTVTAFCATIQGAGLIQILVQRQAQFRRWANPAFWMSLSLSVTAAVMMVLSAPLAARIYREPRIIPLIVILAASTILSSLTLVPNAKLRIGLRFRETTLLGTGEALCVTALTILLATLGAGAYSFVWPALIISIPRIVVFNAVTKTPLPHLKLEVRRWRFFLRDSSAFVASALLLTVIMQGDYTVLGMVAPAAVVGVFYFAFGLSVQVLGLLSADLANILAPALSKIQDDPVRLRHGFVRVVRMLGLVTIPLCLVQAVFIDSAIRVLFHGRWDGAIPIAQILGVGLTLRTVGWSAGAVFQSQGRFGRNLVVNSVLAPLFLGAVTLGAVLGGSRGVAIAESIFFLLSEPVVLYTALRVQGGWRDVVRCFLAPLGVGVITAVGSGVIAHPCHLFPFSDLGRLVVGGLAATLLYLGSLRLFAKGDLKDITAMLKSRLRSSRRPG